MYYDLDISACRVQMESLGGVDREPVRSLPAAQPNSRLTDGKYLLITMSE